MREKRDMDRLGSHLVWPVSLGYPAYCSPIVQAVRISEALASHNSVSPYCLDNIDFREPYDMVQILRLRWLFRAIDEIARSRGQIGGNLLGLTGGNIFLQSLHESEDLHAGRHLAYP